MSVKRQCFCCRRARAVLCQAAQGLLLDQGAAKKKKQGAAAAPLLLAPADVAEAVGVLYQCSASQRFAIVHCACAEDAEYYSTWVGAHSACSLARAAPLISWCLGVPMC